jgi:hypothetical protein
MFVTIKEFNSRGVTVDKAGAITVPKRNMRERHISVRTVHVSHLDKQLHMVSNVSKRKVTFVCVKEATYAAVS